MEQKISDIIKDAEMILVGIGEEFTPACPEFMEAPALTPYSKSRFYEQLPDDHEVIRAYNRLRSLIGAKPYFVVTLNTDDLIYRSGLERDLIVAPCGSMGKMQCGEHIVEAAPVRDAVLAAAEELKHSDAGTGSCGRPEDYAVCPQCGKPLVFHTRETEGYQEEGYLPQWQKYNRWLSCTLNRKLCILELGVGFRYPQVIRWPFEKVTYFNQKATLVRVHSSLPQTARELGDRGIAVKASPVEWIIG